MKTIIAGSRGINDRIIIEHALADSGYDITEVVCGMAQGVDLIGKEIAEDFHIPIKEFPADWDKYGRGAGMIRNKQMAEYADALIAIWDGKSHGTKNMIDLALSYDLSVYILNLSCYKE